MPSKAINDAVAELVAKMVIESDHSNAGRILVETKHRLEFLFVETLDRQLREREQRKRKPT